MDELDPEIAAQYADVAIAPLYTFERFFKHISKSNADTHGWKRITQLPNANYAQPGAEFAPGPSIAASLMVLEFRSGVLGVKAEFHDMEDGEFTESYHVGQIVSYAAYHGKYFWPALVGYITESEEVIQEQAKNGSEALRRCILLFERHLRKYGDQPPEPES